MVESNDLDEMVDIAAAFVNMGKRLPAGNRVAIASSSGGGGAWVADACALAGLDMPILDDATRAKIDVYLPPYGCSQNPVDVTAQAIHERGYAEFARLAAESPNVDGVILVVTGRHPRFLLEDRDNLLALGRDSKKPVLIWSYTRPAAVCVDLLSEAGLPLFTNVHNCARAMRGWRITARRAKIARGRRWLSIRHRRGAIRPRRDDRVQRPPNNFFDLVLINSIADALERRCRREMPRRVLAAQGKSFAPGRISATARRSKIGQRRARKPRRRSSLHAGGAVVPLEEADRGAIQAPRSAAAWAWR